jgi:hypothetical protein
MKKKLSKNMSVNEFENGYWYAVELKDFAKSIGIKFAVNTRKDELEKIIVRFLKSGKMQKPISKLIKPLGHSDLERGLSLDLQIIKYISNKETKSFIIAEALKLNPSLPKKSGSWYWLNRWREEQISSKMRITYGDLVKQFVMLNQAEGRLPRIPSTRFNNFITDFLANQTHSSRRQAMVAWEELKKLNIPKNYQSWVKFRNSNSQLKQ